ncbi:hypothetical protein L9F63_017652, partial [Diploptera punctata]
NIFTYDLAERLPAIIVAQLIRRTDVDTNHLAPIVRNKLHFSSLLFEKIFHKRSRSMFRCVTYLKVEKNWQYWQCVRKAISKPSLYAILKDLPSGRITMEWNPLVWVPRNSAKLSKLFRY